MGKVTLRSRLASNLDKFIGPVWKTRNDAGVQSGVGRTTIDHILNQTRGTSIDTLDKIAAKLGIDPVDLLGSDVKEARSAEPTADWAQSAIDLLMELPEEERQSFLEWLESTVKSNREKWARLATIYGQASRRDA